MFLTLTKKGIIIAAAAVAVVLLAGGAWLGAATAVTYDEDAFTVVIDAGHGGMAPHTIQRKAI